MKEELISIIIPVYNVEKFLNRCIESVINQTYKNLEIILIDDGSLDDSGKLCDNWKEKDDRIKVIHKRNTGLSDTRNVGIEKSTGNYIYFIDSDDYIDLDTIENLYINMIENNSEIAMGDLIREIYFPKKEKYVGESYVANSEEMIGRLCQSKLCTSVCNIIFKKQLFDKIKFPVGKINEDLATLYRLFDKAEIISHIDKAGYHYLQRNGSIAHCKFTKEHLSIEEYKEEILKFVEKRYPNLVKDAEVYFIGTLNDCIKSCKKYKWKEEYKLLKKKQKKYLGRILKNEKVKLRTKIKSILILF